jgi:hypothetical protein
LASALGRRREGRSPSRAVGHRGPRTRQTRDPSPTGG